MQDLVSKSQAGCLQVSGRPDGTDGSGNYKFVFRIDHTGHQSYGQSFTAHFSTEISLVEAPGDVEARAEGSRLFFERKNQLNDNGMTEVWIKLAASGQPEITGITDIACRQEKGGSQVWVQGNAGQDSMQTVIMERRSTRKYKPDMVPREAIDKVLEAGTYAASGMNRQSPIIIAVTDRSVRDQLSAMNAKIMGQEGSDPFYGAPVVLVVLADKDIPTYIYDGSLVMGNMMLAAQDLGLGSCWIHRAKEEFESAEGKEMLKSLGIEGNYEGIGHLILGYAEGEKKAAAPRKESYIYYIGE